MKSIRTRTVWGKDPEAIAPPAKCMFDGFQHTIPNVEAAHSLAVSDASTSYNGRPQTKRFDGFTATYWRGERHTAVISVKNTAQQHVLEAGSAEELNRKIDQQRQAMLRVNHQGTCDVDTPGVLWRADLTFDDGHVETAVAGTEDQLLLKLASRLAESHVAEQPTPPLPYWSVKVRNEHIALRQFLDLLGDVYFPSEKNARQIEAYLNEHNLTVTVKNLVTAFHFCNDRLMLEERP